MRVLNGQDVQQVSGAFLAEIVAGAKKGAAKAKDVGVGGTLGTVVGGAIGAAVGLIGSLF
jgi:hypothetical protein